jgi:hypothetical protein
MVVVVPETKLSITAFRIRLLPFYIGVLSLPSPAFAREPKIMSSSPKPAYPPSLADWEDHRAAITRLYVEEDRNLSEVQHILCQKYHFRSSLVPHPILFRVVIAS